MSNADLINRFMLCPLCRRGDVRIIVRPGGAGPVLEDHRSGIVCCATPTPGVLDARTLLLCKVQCPASGQAVTQMCDGEHAGPEVCGDPQCYHTENPKDGAFAGDDGPGRLRIVTPGIDHDGERVDVVIDGIGDPSKPVYTCSCGCLVRRSEAATCAHACWLSQNVHTQIGSEP